MVLGYNKRFPNTQVLDTNYKRVYNNCMGMWVCRLGKDLLKNQDDNQVESYKNLEKINKR